MWNSHYVNMLQMESCRDLFLAWCYLVFLKWPGKSIKSIHMESGDDTKSRLEQWWITKNIARWPRVKRLFDKQCIKKTPHVPIRTEIWGRKSRNTKDNPYLQDSDPRNNIFGKKTLTSPLQVISREYNSKFAMVYLVVQIYNLPKSNQKQPTLKTTDDGRNLVGWQKSLHHSTWFLWKGCLMRSNTISFKPYVAKSGPDFSGNFWPDYLGLSSKIQSCIFPEKTTQRANAFWSGIVTPQFTRHWGTNLISLWTLQQFSRNKTCNPISHPNLHV